MLHYLVQNDDNGEATEWVLDTFKDDIDINAVTKAGITPLMLTAKRNYDKTAEILLNNNANPFFKDQFGQEASDYIIAHVFKKGKPTISTLLS